MNTLMNIAPMATTPSLAPTNSSAAPAALAQQTATGRPFEGSAPIRVAAAGLPVGSQQRDKLGFDSTGPSTMLQATSARQGDGKWLTKITVPYGEQRGADAMSGTDLSTTMSFMSKEPPTINKGGELYVSGQRVDGNFLETRLHGLKLPLPDYTHFRYGGPKD